MKRIAVVGAFDTKGREYSWLIERIRALNCEVYLVDMGVMNDPQIPVDIRASQTAEAGGGNLEELRRASDRAVGLRIMAQGAAKLVRAACDAGQIAGVISMGGGQGTYMAAEVMRALPIGFPKLIVSTIATSEHDQRQFEGINDTMVVNPLVDIAGDNAILDMVMDRAAAAITGMAQHANPIQRRGHRRIAISMWGVTTPCVSVLEKRLQQSGFEVWVFHETGIGGRIMENLILQGEIDGVVDITIAQLGNQLCGGTFASCDYRCESAGKMGIPQIVSLGGLDMIKYVPPEHLPEKFRTRKQYMHNANLLFVRSDGEENNLIGTTLAQKLNKAVGETIVVLPLKGISAVDSEGERFWDPEADGRLFDALRREVELPVRLVELNMHINDPAFAETVAQLMIQAMHNKYAGLDS